MRSGLQFIFHSSTFSNEAPLADARAALVEAVFEKFGQAGVHVLNEELSSASTLVGRLYRDETRVTTGEVSWDAYYADVHNTYVNENPPNSVTYATTLQALVPAIDESLDTLLHDAHSALDAGITPRDNTTGYQLERLSAMTDALSSLRDNTDPAAFEAFLTDRAYVFGLSLLQEHAASSPEAAAAYESFRQLVSNQFGEAGLEIMDRQVEYGLNVSLALHISEPAFRPERGDFITLEHVTFAEQVGVMLIDGILSEEEYRAICADSELRDAFAEYITGEEVAQPNSAAYQVAWSMSDTNNALWIPGGDSSEDIQTGMKAVAEIMQTAGVTEVTVDAAGLHVPNAVERDTGRGNGM